MGDDQLGTLDAQLDPSADERARHAVSRGAEAHRAQRVDGAGLDRPDGRTQRGQGAQQRALDEQALVGHGHGLAVDAAVDLGAPGRRGGVRVTEVGEGPEADEQVRLA